MEKLPEIVCSFTLENGFYLPFLCDPHATYRYIQNKDQKALSWRHTGVEAVVSVEAPEGVEESLVGQHRHPTARARHGLEHCPLIGQRVERLGRH